MGSGVPDGPLGGLLIVSTITATLVAVVGGVLYQQELGRFLGRLVRRRTSAARPTSLPIERIAHNAQRLRGELAAVPSGTPMARRRGLTSAYDDLLADACRALGVPDTLSGLEPGLQRDCERLRVEQELQDVGFRLSA
jgi:hypothetical protein